MTEASNLSAKQARYRAMVFMAKQFPHQIQAADRIKCLHTSDAGRFGGLHPGGQNVEGPSIRLASVGAELGN